MTLVIVSAFKEKFCSIKLFDNQQHTCEAFNSVVEVFMEFERLGGFPRESDFEKEPARELVLEVASALYVGLYRSPKFRQCQSNKIHGSKLN